MFIIGLTGGIASGKSTVSKQLQEYGAFIIDADKLAKELQEPGNSAWREIVAVFGDGVVLPGGQLDRKALGDVVFNDPKALAQLNEIVHPRVIQRTREIIAELAARSVPVVVLDAPLLIEADMTGLVDEVWVVSVREEIQVERLMARSHLTRHEALARLSSQMPLQDKLRYADRVIDNSGPLEQTLAHLGHLWQELLHIIALRERPEG